MKKNRQFAVIGLGRFGSSIASTLHNLGYEVLAVDNDEEIVQKFSTQVHHVVQADSTDENTLHALGLRNFDVVVVSIGSDIQANLMTTLILKEMKVPYIVAKAQTSLHGRMLEKIGADRVVYPERDMGQRVAHNLISDNVLDYIELSPDLSIVEVTPPNSIVGLTLSETNLRARYGINIMAIKREEHLIVPPLPTEKIKQGDILIVIGGIAGVQKLQDAD